MDTNKLPKKFGLGFILCVRTVFDNDEIVQQFNRLRGCSINKPVSPMEQLVDNATGKLDHDIVKFVEFVQDCIWERLDPQTQMALDDQAISMALKTEPA